MKPVSKNDIEIIFSDDDILVVNKPAPFLTIPDRYNHSEENLYSCLKSKFGEIFVVHRLDKETSGVILFARNAESHRKLCIDFESRSVKKEYVALVCGHFSESSLTINAPIAEHHSKKGLMIVSSKGKESITHITVIERLQNFSLVSVLLETGRTHQIRVHCAHIGHPLAVDPLYGTRKELYLSELKRSYRRSSIDSEKPIISRCTLHAGTLTFAHPSTGEILSFEAEIPKDLKALLNQLRK